MAVGDWWCALQTAGSLWHICKQVMQFLLQLLPLVVRFVDRKEPVGDRYWAFAVTVAPVACGLFTSSRALCRQ